MPYEAETQRLYLERVSSKHLHDFHLLWSSEESMIWSLRHPMKDIKESEQWLQSSLTSVNPNIDKFGIMLKPDCDSRFQQVKENGKIDTGHTDAEEGEETRMIGLLGTIGDGTELVYMLHCDYWKNGYMMEALNAIFGGKGLFWGLENRKHIQHLVAHIDAENVGSMKTIEKVGGRRGERRNKVYGLARDKGVNGEVPEDKLRDDFVWYVDRPI